MSERHFEFRCSFDGATMKGKTDGDVDELYRVFKTVHASPAHVCSSKVWPTPASPEEPREL